MTVAKVAVLIAGCAVMGAFAYWSYRPTPRRTSREIEGVLKQAGLEVDPDLRTRLDRQIARRTQWGAVAATIACTITMPVVFTSFEGSVEDAAGLTVVASMNFGWFLGRAVSAVWPVEGFRSDRVRMAALQPHGLRDYLPLRELVAELALAIVGFGAVLMGVVLVTMDVGGPSRGWMAVLFGLIIGGTALGVLMLQGHLVRTPSRATDQAALVVKDIVLALALYDLFGAAWSTGLVSGVVWLSALAWPFWSVMAFIFVGGAVGWTLFDHRLRPDRVPVAHRLAARSVES